jgi:hypothetical protein
MKFDVESVLDHVDDRKFRLNATAQKLTAEQPMARARKRRKAPYRN